MAKKILTNDDILHLGKLANLTLSEEEVEKYKKQLGETLSYIENLQELDTSKVESTHHTTDLKDVFFEDGTQNTRQFSQEEALKNAKVKKNGYFVVPRIME